MQGSYNDYLASGAFRTTSFGNVTGLGTSARTAGAIILGGPRAGAGSSYRIYAYLTHKGIADIALSNIGQIARANSYRFANSSRNYTFGL
uniref:Uncharacterized protein n=1 Tax=viral metagenome TaxID=1070528 RepID=A0A6C0JFE0_9ZZZZ